MFFCCCLDVPAQVLGSGFMLLTSQGRRKQVKAATASSQTDDGLSSQYVVDRLFNHTAIKRYDQETPEPPEA